jgi:hypothetical protein
MTFLLVEIRLFPEHKPYTRILNSTLATPARLLVHNVYNEHNSYKTQRSDGYHKGVLTRDSIVFRKGTQLCSKTRLGSKHLSLQYSRGQQAVDSAEGQPFQNISYHPVLR